VNEGGCRVSEERCRKTEVKTEAETISEESECVTETWRVGNAEEGGQKREMQRRRRSVARERAECHSVARIMRKKRREKTAEGRR
jgi:hypothetical protein